MTKPKFLTIIIEVGNAEEDLYELHELGVLGSEILSDNQLRCFLAEDSNQFDDIEELCRERGWRIVSSETCIDKNWVQECAEVWQPLAIEDLHIHPLLDERDLHAKKEKTIFIVPGEGFGTGHHPSTRLAIGLLQRAKREFIPSLSNALDFGTGNGILAITTSILWSEAAITAIDNDPCAIPNAAENLRLNQCADKIRLEIGSIEQIQGSFSLITANIYAEVLCNFHQEFIDRLAPDGFLILAGIMRSRAYLIREKFADQHWLLIENRQELDWDAFLFKKKT